MSTPEVDRLAMSPGSTWYERQPPLTCAIEILLLAVLLPAAACWFGKPQALASLAPLLILLPLLFGLRYGFFAGVAAAVAVMAVLLLTAIYRAPVLPQFPKVLASTLLAVGAGAGQFRDRWAAQLRQSHALGNHHAARFSQFAQTFALLRLSHEQLEQQLTHGAVSLRCLMSRLRRNMPLRADRAALPLAGMARNMLELIAEAGCFQAAALYEIDEQGLPGPQPLAMLGRMPALAGDHPMLREALRCGQVLSLRPGTTSVHAEGAADAQAATTAPETLLALVPLADAHGHVHAVISVGAMPFIAISQRTFDVVGLLARQLGDLLTSQVMIVERQHSLAALRRQLARHVLAASQAGLQVSVAACRIIDAGAATGTGDETEAGSENRARAVAAVAEAEAGSGQSAAGQAPCSAGQDDSAAESWIRLCLAQVRATDQAWLCHDRLGRPVIVKAMPLASRDVAEQHLARLAGQSQGRLTIQTLAWEIGPGQSVQQVLSLLVSACDLAEPAPQRQARPGRALRFTSRRHSRHGGLFNTPASRGYAARDRDEMLVPASAHTAASGEAFADLRYTSWGGTDATRGFQIERAS